MKNAILKTVVFHEDHLATLTTWAMNEVERLREEWLWGGITEDDADSGLDAVGSVMLALYGAYPSNIGPLTKAMGKLRDEIATERAENRVLLGAPEGDGEDD